MLFQHVLPRFHLKQRKDEKCRNRESLTAEKQSAVLFPGPEPVYHPHRAGKHLCCAAQSFSSVLDKWKRGKKIQRMFLSGKMQPYVPHPPLLLMLGRMRLLHPKLQKGSQGSCIGYFCFIQADHLMGIISCGSNEVFISALN